MRGRVVCCVGMAEEEGCFVIVFEYTPFLADDRLRCLLRLWLRIRNATRLSAWEEREMALHPQSGAFIGVVKTAARGHTFEFLFHDDSDSDSGDYDDNGGAYYTVVSLPQLRQEQCGGDDDISGFEMLHISHEDDSDDSIFIGSTPPVIAPQPHLPSLSPRLVVTSFGRCLLSRVFRVKH